MYLYINIDDMEFTTSTSGVIIPNTVEISDFSCKNCGSQNLEVISVGLSKSYNKSRVITKVSADVNIGCLDCNNDMFIYS